jgi:hypothetical protein
MLNGRPCLLRVLLRHLVFPADSLSMVTVPFNKDTSIGGNSNFTISMWIFPEDINPYKTLYRQHYTTSGSLGVWLRYIAPESLDYGYLYFGFDTFTTALVGSGRGIGMMVSRHPIFRSFL